MASSSMDLISGIIYLELGVCNLQFRHCRWANYDPIGKEMTGTRFVAFKCPLDESYFHKDVHPDEFFDIHTLVGYVSSLWFYDLVHMPEMSIEWLKCEKSVHFVVYPADKVNVGPRRATSSGNGDRSDEYDEIL